MPSRCRRHRIFQLNRSDFDVRCTRPVRCAGVGLGLRGANPWDVEICNGSLFVAQYETSARRVRPGDRRALRFRRPVGLRRRGRLPQDRRSWNSVDGSCVAQLARDEGWAPEGGTIAEVDCTTMAVSDRGRSGRTRPSRLADSYDTLLVPDQGYGIADGGIRPSMSLPACSRTSTSGRPTSGSTCRRAVGRCDRWTGAQFQPRLACDRRRLVPGPSDWSLSEIETTVPTSRHGHRRPRPRLGGFRRGWGCRECRARGGFRDVSTCSRSRPTLVPSCSIPAASPTGQALPMRGPLLLLPLDRVRRADVPAACADMYLSPRAACTGDCPTTGAPPGRMPATPTARTSSRPADVVLEMGLLEDAVARERTMPQAQRSRHVPTALQRWRHPRPPARPGRAWDWNTPPWTRR